MSNDWIYRDDKKYEFWDSASICCEHILKKETKLTFVFRDLAGFWQFLCDKPVHSTNDGRSIHFHHVFDVEPELDRLPFLALGQAAERKKDGWKLFFPPRAD